MISLVPTHEAAARDVASLEVEPQLGMEMAGDFRAGIVAHRFVAKDDSGDFASSTSCRRNGRQSPGSWLPTIQVQSSAAVS